MTSEHAPIENFEGDRRLDYHAPYYKKESCWNDMRAKGQSLKILRHDASPADFRSSRRRLIGH